MTTPTSPDSQTYTGSELSIAVNETAHYNALTISGTNAGDYTGTLTLKDATNYKWDSANGVVTFTITKADNSISGLTISGWTYGNAPNTPSASADFGEIEYTYYDEENNEVTPVSAGTYTVKASVVGTDNYASAEATTTLVIEKQTVTTPTVESKDYTGETLTADVPTSDLYTVTTNNGGINAGTYTVTLTLTDSDNYKWDSANGVTAFTIDKATPTVTASISGWTYDSATSEPTHNTDDYVTSNVWYEYSTFAESGFSATKPTKAGTYYVIAKVTGTDNYHGATSSAVQFTIAKAQISVPELSYTSVSYNGSAQKPTVANGKYAVIYESENSVNVDEYTVTLSLTDTDNYEWSDGTTDDKDLTYSITKADNAITVSMVGWTYGNTPNSPSATATFGTEFTYAYSSSADGEYSSALPTNAGTYYVKASVVETDNYAGATSNAVAFTIEKKAITPPTIAGKEYTGELLTADVPTSADYTVIENNGGIDKGSYNVVLTLTSDNYKWAGHTDEERFVTLSSGQGDALCGLSFLHPEGWIYLEYPTAGDGGCTCPRIQRGEYRYRLRGRTGRTGTAG